MDRPISSITAKHAALVVAVAAVATVAVAPAGAAEWDFTKRVSLGQYWTDNVTAAPDGFEQSEWITSLSPGFTLGVTSPRGEMDLSYDAQALWYQDNSDFDDVYHSLFGEGQLVLVPNRLFVDGFARYDQENIDPTRRLATGNIFQTGNRTDAAVYGFSPWYTQRLGDWGEALTRFSYQGVRYSNTDETSIQVQDSDTNSILAQLGSQQGKPGLSWLSSVSYQRTDFLFSPEFEYARAALDLGYPVGLRTRVTATAGVESDFLADRTAGGFDEEFWLVGFEWNPTELQSLAVRTGSRFYGTTFEMEWSRRGARGNLDVSYTEIPNTGNQNLIDGGGISTGSRPGAPALNADVYLSKRLSTRATYNLTRTQIAAQLYAERRERAVGDGLDDDVYGLRLSADWDAAPRTRVDGYTRYERRDFGDTQGVSDMLELGVGVRRDLTELFFAEFRVSYLSRDFDTGDDYDINTASITFGAEF